jgi:16S rRNA (uracil1498-N3)-methyltransferase
MRTDPNALTGCQPITLGPIILRVETAAIYCLSILSYELLI